MTILVERSAFLPSRAATSRNVNLKKMQRAVAMRRLLSVRNVNPSVLRILATPQRTITSGAPKLSIPNIGNDNMATANKKINILSEAASIITTETDTDIELYHLSSMGMAVLLPLGLLLSPSVLAAPIDFATGFVLPYHTHIGMIQVIEDYVPRPHQKNAKIASLVLTVLIVIGLLKINLCGAGISESLKAFWRTPEQNKKTSNKQH